MTPLTTPPTPEAPQRASERVYTASESTDETRSHRVIAAARIHDWFGALGTIGRGLVVTNAHQRPKRRARDHEGVVRLSCRITPEEARELDEACALLNMNRSDVQRHALRFLLKNLHHRKDAA